MADLTVAELARRLNVHRSTLARAIDRGRKAAAEKTGCEAPPGPVNPGEPQPRYPEAAMTAWWPKRPDGRRKGTP